MENGYTIYFGEKPYYITNTLDQHLEKLADTAGTIVANHPDSAIIAKTISDIEREGTKAVIVLTNLPDHYWGIFQSHFTPITAGGGIVLNDLDETLFIYRRGKWDLPKGKLDEGETIEECALREVKEETGLKIVELISKVGNTYHTYHEKKKHILKTTVWFKMLAPGHQELRPQTEEDIEEMVWSSPGNWNEVFSNTYPLIPIILERSVVK